MTTTSIRGTARRFSGSRMLPLSTEFAIREAVKLLIASRRHFRSSQVEQARKLLELALTSQPTYPIRRTS